MRQRFCIKTDPSTSQFSNIKPKERSNQQKCRVAQCICLNREMSYDLTRVPQMEDTKGKCGKKNRQKHIRPCLSTAFTVDENNYEDAEYDPSIDKDKE